MLHNHHSHPEIVVYIKGPYSELDLGTVKRLKKILTNNIDLATQYLFQTRSITLRIKYQDSQHLLNSH